MFVYHLHENIFMIAPSWIAVVGKVQPHFGFHELRCNPDRSCSTNALYSEYPTFNQSRMLFAQEIRHGQAIDLGNALGW